MDWRQCLSRLQGSAFRVDLRARELRDYALTEWFGEWEESRAYFKVPESPGLGIKISEAAIRAQSVPIDQAERES